MNTQMNFIIYYHYLDLYKILFSGLAPKGRIVWINNGVVFKALRIIAVHKMKIPFLNVLKYWVFLLIVRTAGRIKLPGDNLCFIVQPGLLIAGMKDFILRKYPQAKFVCLFTDLVDINKERQLLLNEFRDQVDLIVTYDEGDSKKYNLPYLHLPFSNIDRFNLDFTISSDLCFVGLDKGRLELVYEIAEKCEREGLVCDFHLIHVPFTKRRTVKGITFHDNYISYKECLSISARSRCILELIQEDSIGNTVRIPEAIFLGKKLLSNNSFLVNKDCFVPENMKVFSFVDEIDKNFIRTECKPYSQELKNSFSPDLFFGSIQRLLELQKTNGGTIA